MNPYREKTKWDEYWNAHEDGVDFQGLVDFWAFLGTQMTAEEWAAKSGEEQQTIYFAWKNGDTEIPTNQTVIIKNQLSAIIDSLTIIKNSI